jgi:hypothetical protein
MRMAGLAKSIVKGSRNVYAPYWARLRFQHRDVWPNAPSS